MNIDEFEFEPFSEVRLLDLFNTIGVYVLWDSQAKKNPSYIGEGKFFNRFNEHEDKYAHPINGFLAIGGYKETPSKPKKDSELLEAILLHIADRIGKTPLHNSQKNYKSPILKYFKNNRVLRFVVSGYDPFSNPEDDKKIRKAEIYLCKKDNKLLLEKHPWKSQQIDGYGKLLFEIDN